MLERRRRRRANIEPTLGKRLVFAMKPSLRKSDIKIYDRSCQGLVWGGLDNLTLTYRPYAECSLRDNHHAPSSVFSELVVEACIRELTRENSTSLINSFSAENIFVNQI